MPPPADPRIYHIVHVDRLESVISDGFLWCEADVARRTPAGTTIGMNRIKHRRFNELALSSHPGLYVGACVPFYFCPRSIMLFVIYKANDPELTYRGGQDPIVHLEADLHRSVDWANRNGHRWAFTLSNAGAYYFEDRSDLAELDEVDWNAVRANRWSGSGISSSVKEGKQAEFLMEGSFPWDLVDRIGVRSRPIYDRVRAALATAVHKPRVDIKRDWYY